MIAAIAFMMAAPAAVPVEVGEEIVVIARRAKGVRWDWRVRKGVLTKCKITRSSGDSVIDQIGCEATRQCVATGLRKVAPMRNCIVSRRTALIEQLAATRAAQN